MEDVSFNEEQFEKGVSDIEPYFKFARGPMQDYLIKNETAGAKKAGWTAIAIISPVILILIAGILMFPVMIILLLCKCTKCLCCSKEDPSKPLDSEGVKKLEKCKSHIKSGSICLIVSVLIAGIVWVIYAFMMLKSFG